MQRFIISLLFLGIFFQANAQKKTFSMLFAGDLMMHKEQIWSGKDKKTATYNFDTTYYFVKKIISQADIAIVNLEVPLGIKPYRGYPQFSSPPAVATAAKNAGFDVLLTANNHSLDKGKKGLEKNIQVLDSLKIPYLGTYKDQAQRDSCYPLYLNKDGIKIALLNYTYGTNGIKVRSPNIVNYIDKDQIKKDLEKAEKDGAQIKIICIHWGLEYKLIPNSTQKKIYKYCREYGANLVIGSHPHVIQPMMFYDSTNSQNLVVYSLGNFVSHQRAHPKDGGAMLQVNFEIENNKWKIKDAGYYLTWVHDHYGKDKKEYFIIMPISEYLHKADFFQNVNQYNKMKYFYTKMNAHLKKNNINIKSYEYGTTTKKWSLSK